MEKAGTSRGLLLIELSLPRACAWGSNRAASRPCGGSGTGKQEGIRLWSERAEEVDGFDIMTRIALD
ncbi:hypothetical protein OPV22_028205 [Ensete ventricosum]|uniref:Uncharacterized protein n=1 Tax=Ensete ventricosum TaxID=4639 RepID=A0AAV8PXK1_ENSVE|nr:hypothetical protein OPV22_028205 [Ensete ventricosum]